MFIDEAKIAVQLQPREHRPDLRPRQGRRQLLHRDRVRPRQDLRAIFDRLPQARASRCPIAHGLLRHHEGLRGPRLRAQQARRAGPRAAPRPPRRLAAERPRLATRARSSSSTSASPRRRARPRKTQAGILKGKFGYMSPEQVRGLPIDRRSDIFARRHRALRAAHRRAPVRRRERLLDAREGAQRRDPAAVDVQPEDPRRARAHRAQGARARTSRIATRTRSTCTTSCRPSSTPPASSTRARISRRG